MDPAARTAPGGLYGLGKPQKVVALELGLSPATLAGLVKMALADLGLDVRCSRVPLALPLLLHAAQGSRVVALCEVGEGERSTQHRQVSLGLPEQVLTAELSRGELDVARAYLVGQSYAEIAKARGTSTRTVGNQLSQTFQKLGASGRFSLIATLVERAAQQEVPLTLTLRATPPTTGEAPPSIGVTLPKRAMSA